MIKEKIDYIKNIEIDMDSLPITNIQDLDYLKEGIFYLAEIVKNKEERNEQQNDIVDENGYTPNINTAFYWSNKNKENNLLLNQFNWFAISCVNYVRIIGLLDIMIKNNWKTIDIKIHDIEIKKYCTEYIREVILELYDWRNKISAHPSITDSKPVDNFGSLEFSLMNQISYSFPHYYVGAFQWSTEGEQSNMKEWSLVDVFENKMIPRYWPDSKIIKLK